MMLFLGFEYSIHPSIGVARVGNSTSFYLSPVSTGTRPIECDEHGNEKYLDEKHTLFQYVKKFKKLQYDADTKKKESKIRKQAAKFRVYRKDTSDPNSKPVPIDLTDCPEIKNVTWRVHLANKKAAWYHFNEFYGDLMIGEKNTYESHEDVHLRNADIEKTDPRRKQLIIDFGWRELNSKEQSVIFQNDSSKPEDYAATIPYHQLMHPPKIGKGVKSLGEIKTDSKMNLVVLGGYGNAGGDEAYASFAGGNGWYDDMSDGPVLCEITLADGKDTKIPLDAWVIVGPPKFAPELVNITTLDDTMLDVAIRFLGSNPNIYDKNKKEWKQDYHGVNYERDIEPIIKRIGHYRWVANLPSMMDFCMPSFNLRDNSKANYKKRQRFFSYFRRAPDDEKGNGGSAQVLFSPQAGNTNYEDLSVIQENDYINGIPLMPLNSGSNAVENTILDKFVTLSRTQYFFLQKWADGDFTVGKADDIVADVVPLDHADIGNCVGAPMCPGVEVTWSVRNPRIYSAPLRIKHKTKHLEDYTKLGLDPNYDETSPSANGGNGGCEPGDLTKRMAIPWMSDLFECNIQHISFADKDKNKNPRTGLEAPPTYYAYWWPPQSPWDVILGVTDPEEEDPINRKKLVESEIKAAGVSAGQQVNYIRGINSHMQMVNAWSYLGFIVNQNEEEDRDDYPYFVEKERNHEKFDVVGLAVGNKINIVDPGSTRFVPGFYLKEDTGEYT